MIDLLKRLVKNSVQYGHQTWRWCPKMKPYIWGQKGGVHLIDVSKTAYHLEKAARFLESVAAAGQPIVWVGTKKAAQAVIKKTAESINCPYVTHRWIGGTFTNPLQIKKSLTKLGHFEDILSKTDKQHYTKKEYGVFQKIVDRLLKNVGGIRTMGWPVGAVVIIDVRKEHVVVREAIAAGIPIVALVDTNGDPSMIDYVIPGNDDVPRSIATVADYLAQAVKRGQEKAEVKEAIAVAEEALSEGNEHLVKALETTEDEESKSRKRTSRPSHPAPKKAPYKPPFKRPVKKDEPA